MSPVRECLPTLGLNRAFPDALLFGPKHVLGMGIPDLFHSQGIEHLKQILLVAHRSEDLIGALIRGSLKQLKLEVGLGGSLFSHLFAPFQQVTTCSWLTCTWQFTSAFRIQLDERTPCLQLH
jgi:hypothetical protein